MCGIVGIVDNTPTPQPPGILDCLLATMTQRGPDGEGRFVEGPVAMGMRRLAVIDIQGGTQPLKNRDGSVVAFQNGEIYNHASLRCELESGGAVFKTLSDTEVLAHGYDQWGIDGLLDRLDGMYAIAILDRRTHTLHLARDRFGEKPLFYCCKKDRFAYSSNTTALGLLPWMDLQLDSASVDRYLALHYVPGDRTIFSGITRVLPGERLTVNLQSLNIHRTRYYFPALCPVEDVTVEALRERIEYAVTSRLVADVPVGVFLSGGVDSSVLAAIAARHHPGINTFSIGFKDNRYDESPFAETVARAIGSTHHHFTFDEHAFQDLLPAVVEGLDEPIGDQALLPTYWLCREARKHVTVVLSGEGADEVFAGYDYYGQFIPHPSWLVRAKAFLRRRVGVHDTPTLCDNFWPITPSGFPLVMDRAQRRHVLLPDSYTDDSWERHVLRTLHDVDGALQRATLADVLTWLPDDLLVKLDRMAMANSLEGRAPFLQPALVESALRLPSAKRMTAQRSKVALREIASALLPATIVGRKKHGFILPMATWLGRWLHQIESLRTYVDLPRCKGWDADAAAALVAQEMTYGCKNERLLFSIVLLAEWQRAFWGRLASFPRVARNI